MNKETQIVWLPIAELVPYEHNAKEHTPKQIDNIKKSLTDYGWQNPCLITKDNVLIAGHGRVMAAQELGITEVPCIYADDLTEEQIKEYRHLDNLLSEGGYIESELKYELQTVDLSGYDFSEIPVEIEKVENTEYYDEDYGTDFSLPDGEKEPFMQMAFTLANEQADAIKNALKKAKAYCKDYDNYGNENGNGNALYAMVRQWETQRT